MMDDSSSRLLTVREIATYLGCTPRHVQNLLPGGLPHLKLGRLLRFRRDEIDAYLSENRYLRSRA